MTTTLNSKTESVLSQTLLEDMAARSQTYDRENLFFGEDFRDVAMGGIHPANNPLTHEIMGKTHLGVLGATPRWG